MRRSAFFLMAVLASGVILSHSGRALAQNRLAIPREALGFQGTLSAEVVKAPDPKYGWFEVKVVKVLGFSAGNRSRVRNARALTDLWKDKCAAVRGVKGMPPLKVGDRVTVNVYNFEAHLRARRVTKNKPVETKPDGKPKPKP